MNFAYGVMLFFIFWCAYTVAQKHYRIDDSRDILEVLLVNFIRLMFAGIATFFFYEVW